MNGLMHFFYRFLHYHWLYFAICISIQFTLAIGLVWLLRRPLRKVASLRRILSILCTPLMIFFLTYPIWWDKLDLRSLYSLLTGRDVDALFHLSIPVSISSQIVGVPSLGNFNWLALASLFWLAGLIVCLRISSRRERPLRKLLCTGKPCPEALEALLLETAQNDERWLVHQAGREKPQKLRLVWIPELTSPCTFNGHTDSPTIALDRLDYTEQELRNIFRHELAHIALNHEEFLGTLSWVRVYCWFCPLFSVLERWCRRQMELACDEWALNRPQTTPSMRISYARLLLSIAEEQHVSGPVLYLSASAAFVRQRIEAILHPSRKPLSLPIAILIVVLAMHTTLIIVPGQLPEDRFTQPADFIACLGNIVEDVAWGLDPDFDIDINSTMWKDFYVKFIVEDSLVCAISAYGDSDDTATLKRMSARMDLWPDTLFQLFGEPKEHERKLEEFIVPHAVERWKWTVEITPQAARRLGAASGTTAADLVLTLDRQRASSEKTNEWIFYSIQLDLALPDED